MRPNRHDDDNVLDWQTAKLLREVAVLRAEVAALHREVEALRSTAAADVVDVLVQAFRQLPQRLLNRERGFRRIGEEKGSLCDVP
jgi:hypothetical protein